MEPDRLDSRRPDAHPDQSPKGAETAMAEDTDRTVAAILAAGLLAREASHAWAGDQERVPHQERADHAVDIYRACLKSLRKDADRE
jgi:hypothetical protein